MPHLFCICTLWQLLINAVHASENTDCMFLNKQTVLLSILAGFRISGVFYRKGFFIEVQLCNERLVFVWLMNLPEGWKIKQVSIGNEKCFGSDIWEGRSGLWEMCSPFSVRSAKCSRACCVLFWFWSNYPNYKGGVDCTTIEHHQSQESTQ